MGVSSGTLHIDTALTNVSVMYRNAEFVADEVYPPLPVNKQSNKYFVYGLDNLRPDDDSRRPAGLANEIDWNVSANPYYTDGHALSQYIPDEWRENADNAIDLDTDTTVQLTDKILLNQEINVFNAVNALTAHSLAATPFDSPDTDPVVLIDQARETILLATGKKPNRLLLPTPTLRGLRNNPQVKARVSGAQSFDASLITLAQLAAVLNVEQVIEAAAIKVTSAEGQTVTTDWIWGKNALLYYKPPAPGLRTIALGYLFTWMKGRLGGLVYKDRANKRHADWIEVMKYYDPRTVVSGAGYWMTNCVS